MMRSRAGAAAVLAVLLASVGAHAAPCTPDEYVAQVATVPTLTTSATLLGVVLAIMGGAPTNSSVFLPTNAAWEAFRAENGASAPDVNRTVAIFLYNSILGLGEATTATLAAASPIETSAGVLQSYVAQANVLITISVTAAANDTAATATGKNGVTGTLGKRYQFCDGFSYAVDKVLLPAADYATTPATYYADITAINARIATQYPPVPAAVLAPSVATPAPTSPAVVTPVAAPVTPTAAPTTPTVVPMTLAAAPPPPASAATLRAEGSAFTLACGLAGAAFLLLA